MSSKRIIQTAFSVVLSGLLSTIAFADSGQGMTWSKLSHNSTLGIDQVSCNNGASDGCNAYHGDTNGLPLWALSSTMGGLAVTSQQPPLCRVMSSPAQPLEMGFAKIASVLAGVWPNSTTAVVAGACITTRRWRSRFRP